MAKRPALRSPREPGKPKAVEAVPSRSAALPVGPVSRDWFWLVLLLVPPLLLFPRLGQPRLWQDEGETALLGQSVLQHGYPLAVGTRIITDQPGGVDINASGIWIWTPWLAHYVAALSFALLGVSTFTARLPFALAGWATFLVSYAVFLELSRNRRLSRYALALLLGSVPFLIHARQCRYYTLLALFCMLQLWGYLRLTRGQRSGAWMFTVGGIGLYYAFFPQLVASTAAMWVHALRYHRRRDLLLRLLVLSAIVAAATLPFFVYTRSWSRSYQGSGYGFDSLARYLSMLRGYMFHVHVWAFPGVLLLAAAWMGRACRWPLRDRILVTSLCVVWLLAALQPAGPGSLGLTVASAAGATVWFGSVLVRKPERAAAFGIPAEELALVALVLVTSVLLVAGVSNYAFFRYVLGLLPLSALATASLVFALSDRPRVALPLIACLIGCNLIQLGPLTAVHAARGNQPLAPRVRRESYWGNFGADRYSEWTLRFLEPLPRIRSFALDYIDEITHDYVGPVGTVVRYLRANARPTDVVLTTYEHFPLMFHTDLRVYSAVQRLPAELPDWVWLHGDAPPVVPPDVAKALEDGTQYEQVPIEGTEYGYENIPEPNHHLFRSPSGEPPLVLFHRLR